MLELRALGAADGDALDAKLEAARARGDLRASSDADLLFTRSLFAVEPGMFGGAFTDGRLVGLVVPELKVTIVVPELRRTGIGRRLIELAVDMEAARGRPELIMGTIPDDDIATAFLQATGFALHSAVWDLVLDRKRAVPPPAWPADLIVRSFDATRDVIALPPLVNAAFADHPTPIIMEEAMVRASLDDPNIRDEDAILLEDRATGELVGFCLCDLRRTDGVPATEGELGMIGVRPDRQGRGLGRQLIRAGVAYVRGLGVGDVRLAVNGRNAGALALYESEGFVRVRTRDRWARPVADRHG